MVVDLPAPFGSSSPNISPALISKDRSLTTGALVKVLETLCRETATVIEILRKPNRAARILPQLSGLFDRLRDSGDFPTQAIAFLLPVLNISKES